MILGLLVPALNHGGGVPAVARFVKDVALRGGSFELKLVSLSMDSADPCSMNVIQPRTWTRGVACAEGQWEGLPFTHVGASFGEFEFQRYKPRAALTCLLSDCDLIQVVCGSPAWANAVLGLGKPVALQVATRSKVERRHRATGAQGPVNWWRRGMTRITDRMDDRALRHVDAIQVENPWMLDYVRALNVRRAVDIRYAPPGIDARAFCPTSMRDLCQAPYILCVGRLDDPRKNPAMLLEAYACLPARLRDGVRLVLAGAASPPAAFWARAGTLGLRERISFVERPDQVALVSLYQRAAVFALPSDEEGFGMVVVEAMACGIPVVATRCGGPDGIITDGEDGYLVPRDDIGAMADRLTRLLSDPPTNRAMGAKARETVERRYEERLAGEAFVDAWNRLLRKTRLTGL